MNRRRHNLPEATTRSRGLSAASGGSVATIASATVSRIASPAGDPGVTRVHNHPQVLLPPDAYRDDATLVTAASNALAASATMPGVEATAGASGTPGSRCP